MCLVVLRCKVGCPRCEVLSSRCDLVIVLRPSSACIKYYTSNIHSHPGKCNKATRIKELLMRRPGTCIQPLPFIILTLQQRKYDIQFALLPGSRLEMIPPIPGILVVRILTLTRLALAQLATQPVFRTWANATDCLKRANAP